jgi:hypothetical protein
MHTFVGKHRASLRAGSAAWLLAGSRRPGADGRFYGVPWCLSDFDLKVACAMARSRTLRLVAGLAVTASAVVAPVVFAASASAVTNLVFVRASSAASGTEGFKSAIAACPAGTQVLGGGADIVGGGHGVKLSSLRPQDFDESFYADASADPRGYDGNWRLDAFAICASPVSGREIVHSFTGGGPGETDISAQANCPAGKQVIGTGATVDANSVAVLDDVMPDFDLSGVTAEVMHDGTPVSGDTQLTAEAIAVCVDPLPGQQLAFQTTPASTGDKGMSATCPSGTQVHGAGAGLSGAYGEAHLDRIGFNGVGGLGASDVDAREDVDGSSNNWSAWAFAICAA